jgi:hypothetical protein
MSMNFAQALKASLVEKDVESAYRQGIRQHFQASDPNAKITSPYGCDGLLHVPSTGLTALLEFKYDLDFKKPLLVGMVLLQSMAYMRKIEAGGPPLPTMVFIGDLNEMFVVHANALIPFFEEDIDWNVAPSSIGALNPALALKIGESVNPFIRPVQTDGDLREALEYMVSLDQGTVKLIRLSETNIAVAFEHFKTDVLKKTLGANEDVSVFIGVLTSKSDYYLHPQKKGVLVAPSGEVKVNAAKFESLFKHFDRDLSVREKEHLRSICDRLILDDKRRRDGAFFTPTAWVDKAHTMISEAYGDNWRDEFVVWDCACGTGNLTRDYRFKELYCSTLIPGELETMVSGGVSPEATRFVFDFLNDDIDDSGLFQRGTGLPDGLIAAFESGKDVMFLINPPYGTANDKGAKGTDKAGIAHTAVNRMMAKEGIGASRQLYAQFLYRIDQLRNWYGNRIVISLFSPPLYMTGGSFDSFRKKVLGNYGMNSGMVFQASHFADVSGAWGISFTIWDSSRENTGIFNHNIAKMGEEYIVFDGIKTFYNLDGTKPASEWVREPIKGLKTYDAPQVSSAINLKGDGRGKVTDCSLGYMQSNANSTYDNPTLVALYSTPYSSAQGFPISPTNFDRVIALFATRKSIKSDWLNQKDEYSAPDESHPAYAQFLADAHVYSLFNNSSQQSSLRQITYKDKIWDIPNHFFWRTREDIMRLANAHGFDACYADAKRSQTRYMAQQLQALNLSPEAQAVLDKANAIYDASWAFRVAMHEEDESLHLHAWDAGWYQVKRIASIFLKAELTEFSKLYKALEAKMTEATYEVEFLRP